MGVTYVENKQLKRCKYETANIGKIFSGNVQVYGLSYLITWKIGPLTYTTFCKLDEYPEPIVAQG
jgi:hypothetical protein